MSAKKSIICILFVIALSCTHGASAFTKEFHIDYRLDSISIDSTYMDNRARIAEVLDFVGKFGDNKALSLDSILFSGTASPDGYVERNRWLSQNRLNRFKDLIKSEYGIADSLIVSSDSYITWIKFRNDVANSDIPWKEEILDVLDQPADTVRWYRGMHTDSRILKLRTMKNGWVWEYLKPILNRNRFATVTFNFHYNIYKPSLSLFAEPNVSTPMIINSPTVPLIETWTRRLYVKTNFIDWSLLIANVAVEVDLARHWSFNLPVFYSKWDYFRPEIRFRVAGFQPELRYWFNSVENSGWFLGAHFGLSYYNMGFNGEHRYQDYNGKTPTTGGGLSFGWRKHLGAARRWLLEFSAGAGIYPLHYDVFENTHDYHLGTLVDTRKKTFYGLDQANVSIGYTFDLYKQTKIKAGN